jgi:hypothetical protein
VTAAPVEPGTPLVASSHVRPDPHPGWIRGLEHWIRSVSAMTGPALDLGTASHMALVIDDLAPAMSFHSNAFGVTWTEPWTGEIPIVVDGSRSTPVVTFTYAKEGPPHLELIETVPGTLWRPGPGFHHIGFWVDDVAATAATLEGWVIEATGDDSGFAYLQSQDGLRIELVDNRSSPNFARWIAGGRL